MADIKKARRGSKRHKHDDTTLVAQQKKDPGIQIEGVTKVTLQTVTQKILNCVIGEHVTSEVPWKFVSKETVEDNIELHDESSDFLPIKDLIKEFQGDKLLVGYNAHADEENEFYVCVTKEAEQAVMAILDQVKAAQEQKIRNAIHKQVKPWTSLGSEVEVDENIIKDSRPLKIIEAVTTIGQIRDPTMFSDRNADEGYNTYVEFGPPRFEVKVVNKRRVHVGVQVTPSSMENEAQTVPGLPINACTQYEYSVDIDKQLDDKEVVMKLGEFLETNTEGVCQELVFNETFDLHKRDYEQLVADEKDTKPPQKVHFHEYQSFSDVKNAKGRFISCCCWHPMWTGIVAVGYARNTKNNVAIDDPYFDSVRDDVFDEKSCLIWSIADSLNPKLILECPRDIHTLAFCPWNENILVGGGVNGQIVVWDIFDKLEAVETEIIRSPDQERHHIILDKLMTWLKPAKAVEYVSPTAVSDLEYSHVECITDIKWLNPYWRVTNIGKVRIAAEDDETMQFITSSLDGSVDFWDLNAPIIEKPQSSQGGSKRKKKATPIDASKYVSQYRGISRLFKPQFRLKIIYPGLDEFIPLTSMSFNVPPYSYHLVDDAPAKRLTDRVRYAVDTIPWPSIEDLPFKELHVGTADGNIVMLTWDGLSFVPAEAVASETGHQQATGSFHDGPLTALCQSPFIRDILLSVGGRIFAIWKEGFLDFPIFYRRAEVSLSSCMWSPFRPSMFFITLSNGTLQIWDVILRSNAPTLVQTISGKILTGTFYHSLPLPRNVIGIADFNGSLRLFFIPDEYSEREKDDIEETRLFFEREFDRRERVLKVWQNKWLETNAERLRLLQLQDDQIEADRKYASEMKAMMEEAARRARIEELRKIESKKSAEDKIHDKTKKRLEKVQETRMTQVIMSKKNMKIADAIAKRQPLEELKEQTKEKIKKVTERHNQRERIFESTITTLFPETNEPIHTTASQPYVLTEEFAAQKHAVAKGYEAWDDWSMNFLAEHPYQKDKDWLQVLDEGKAIRKSLDVALSQRNYHQTRYELRCPKIKVKKVKKVDSEEAGGEAPVVEQEQVYHVEPVEEETE